MGIGLVADELKANGNPPAEYIFTEPSSFKVIVKSADPYGLTCNFPWEATQRLCIAYT